MSFSVGQSYGFVSAGGRCEGVVGRMGVSACPRGPPRRGRGRRALPPSMIMTFDIGSNWHFNTNFPMLKVWNHCSSFVPIFVWEQRLAAVMLEELTDDVQKLTSFGSLLREFFFQPAKNVRFLTSPAWMRQKVNSRSNFDVNCQSIWFTFGQLTRKVLNICF